MNKIYFVTGNKNKAREAQEILDIPIEIADFEVDEVQSLDLEYVSKKKAEAAFEKLKKPLIVDDVGTFVEAWNGFPGPLIRHLKEAVGEYGILDMLKSEPNKKVRIVDAISYHDGKKIHTFIGDFTGTLVEKRGDKGFGFDPIVVPDGFDITFAEMDSETKHKVSHRGKALAKLKAFLDSQEV